MVASLGPPVKQRPRAAGQQAALAQGQRVGQGDAAAEIGDRRARGRFAGQQRSQVDGSPVAAGRRVEGGAEGELQLQLRGDEDLSTYSAEAAEQRAVISYALNARGASTDLSPRKIRHDALVTAMHGAEAVGHEDS